MIAVALALSIDYSLFLLSRFSEELALGKPIEAAVDIMLATSGHTVLVSGTTLCMCFLGMLCIPVTTISSMGLAAAVTVIMAIGLALSLTPALLLTFPNFFSANRRFGLTLDGVSCLKRFAEDSPLSHLTSSLTSDADVAAGSLPFPEPPEEGCIDPAAEAALTLALKRPTSPSGCWATVGRYSQRFAIPILLLAGGVCVPLAMVLPSLDYVEGVLPLLPHEGPATGAFVTLQRSFGVGTVFPNTLLIEPRADADMLSSAWLLSACDALQAIASNVTSALAKKKIDYNMSFADFTGVMVLQGQCTHQIVPLLMFQAPWLTHYLGTFMARGENKATQVQVDLKLNPFSYAGQQWIKAMRDAMAIVSSTDEVQPADNVLS